MAVAPRRQGDLPETVPLGVSTDSQTVDVWSEARPLARAYRQAVAGDDRLSLAFRALGGRWLDRLGA